MCDRLKEKRAESAVRGDEWNVVALRARAPPREATAYGRCNNDGLHHTEPRAMKHCNEENLSMLPVEYDQAQQHSNTATQEEGKCTCLDGAEKAVF